jgi:hypothetical protein
MLEFYVFTNMLLCNFSVHPIYTGIYTIFLISPIYTIEY